MLRLACLLATVGALLLAAPTRAQSPVPTLTVGGTPVHPAEYGYFYDSALTTSDLRLRDGSRAELWMFEGVAGDCVVVEGLSDAFDIYLMLRHGEPFGDTIAEDDDGAGGRNARLRLTLPRGGTYFVAVTSAGRGEVLGRYRLDLDRCP